MTLKLGLTLGMGLNKVLSRISDILSIGTGELYFADNLSTYGWYVATTPTAFYDATSNKTWACYEGWDGASRAVYVTVFDHATLTWTNRVKAITSYMHDDDHGVPAMVMDASGYVHIYFGAHNGDLRWCKSNSPRDPSAWTELTPKYGDYLTYPHPNVIGSNIVMIARSFGNSYTAPNRKYTGVIYKNTTSAWASKLTFMDWGDDSRFYSGNCVVDGSGKIHFVVTRADFVDTYRRDLFYMIYDPVAGTMSNHDGSHVVAEASFPIDLTDSNTYFRIYTHDTSGATDALKYSGNIPAMCLDSNGKPHVVFFNGLTTGVGYAGGGFADIDIMYMNKVGASWSTPEIIGNCSQKYDGAAITALADGEVQVLMVSDSVSDNSARGGNILKRTRAADGTWSASSVVKSQALPYALDYPNAVLNGHSDFRFVFLEASVPQYVDGINAADDDKAGYQRAFAYGDRGFVRNTANISIARSVDNFAEDATIGSTLAVLTASHPRATFSIVNDPDNKFDISGSNLISTAAFDYETKTTHSVTIRASLRDKTYDTTFVFNVTDVADSPPANTALPVISGTFNQGQNLSVSNGTWTGSPTYTYQWTRDTVAISGATSSTYLLVADDVGTVVACTVTATNAYGSADADAVGDTVAESLDPPLSSDANFAGWYDGLDASTMTLVGSAVDVWSPKLGSVAQAVSAGSSSERPAFASGTGITFDGVDDLLTNSSPFLMNTNGMTAFVIGTFASNLAGGCVFSEASSSSTLPFYTLGGAPSGTLTDDVSWGIRDKDSVFQIAPTVALGSLMNNNTPCIALYEDKTTEVNVYKSGVKSSASPLAYTRRGAVATFYPFNTFSIGGLRRTTKSGWEDFTIKGLLCWQRTLTTAEKNQVGQWAATYYGISWTDIT